MADDLQDNQSSVIKSFQSVFGDKELLSKVIEFFPYPIHVYSLDGMMVLTNEACLRVMHIPSKEHLIGKFNVLKDPVIDKWGEEIRAQIERAFQGEIVHFQNLNMPIRGIMDRFETSELCFDSCYQNIICYPLYDDQDQLAYVVHVFVTSKMYDGKEEMVKGKEYIETHWLDAFDVKEVAKAANLSRTHFSRLFKKHTGMTPHEYYISFKIGKLKEKLSDANLSISQAFAACGLDYNGYFTKVFKEKTGYSPSQYRKNAHQG